MGAPLVLGVESTTTPRRQPEGGCPAVRVTVPFVRFPAFFNLRSIDSNASGAVSIEGDSKRRAVGRRGRGVHGYSTVRSEALAVGTPLVAAGRVLRRGRRDRRTVRPGARL